MNAGRVLSFLLAAVEHARGACGRTLSMVRFAIARFEALLLIARAAA